MAELYMETLSIRPSNDRGHLTASTAGHPWPLWQSRRGTIFAALFWLLERTSDSRDEWNGESYDRASRKLLHEPVRAFVPDQ